MEGLSLDGAIFNMRISTTEARGSFKNTSIDFAWFYMLIAIKLAIFALGSVGQSLASRCCRYNLLCTISERAARSSTASTCLAPPTAQLRSTKANCSAQGPKLAQMSCGCREDVNICHNLSSALSATLVETWP